MSKANRRRQRPGNQPSTRPATPPGTNPPATTPAGDPAGTGPSAASAGAASAGASDTPRAPGTTGSDVRPGTPRPAGTGSRPQAARHGRRERQRAVYQPSFVQRYRTAIVVIAAVAGVALLSAFVFASAAQPAYACSTIWTPQPTASPAPSATPNLGYVQPDMGRDHVSVGTKVTYTYCAPASGSHDNASGSGPIPARVYGPGDNANPEGWIHNLEHGALVLLYQGASAGATIEGQAQLKAFYDAFPNSPRCGFAKGQIGPIIARFDDMSTPFQAILWGRVLPLQTFDQAQILAFWNQWGERTNPEDQCPSVPRAPTTSSAPASSAAPSGSAAPSPS